MQSEIDAERLADHGTALADEADRDARRAADPTGDRRGERQPADEVPSRSVRGGAEETLLRSLPESGSMALREERRRDRNDLWRDRPAAVSRGGPSERARVRPPPREAASVGLRAEERGRRLGIDPLRGRAGGRDDGPVLRSCPLSHGPWIRGSLGQGHLAAPARGLLLR